MERLPEWWSSKEFEELSQEHENELLRERVLRLENLYNTLVEWINEHETKGDPAPK